MGDPGSFRALSTTSNAALAEREAFAGRGTNQDARTILASLCERSGNQLDAQGVRGVGGGEAAYLFSGPDRRWRIHR